MTNHTQYHWKGLFSSGERTHGLIDANSTAAAKAELRKQGIIALKITKKRTFSFTKRRRINPSNITQLTRQLTTLIKAGISLNHSFELLMASSNNQRMKALIRNIRADVGSGLMFSQALGKHPSFFNPLFCCMVRAGEQSGSLDTMLVILAEYRERLASIRKKLHQAMAYPIAVTIIALLVTGVLLTRVIPQFDLLFQSFHAELPRMTKHVIHLSNFFKHWWLIMATMSLGLIYGFNYARKRSPKVSKMNDQFILAIPFIGEISRKLFISRFSRTLSISYTAGLPLTEALKSVSGVTGNVLFTQAINQIRENISQGQSLKQAMKSTLLFPEMVLQLISIGEETGTLDRMLSKIADVYEEDINTLIDTMGSLLEPVTMTLLGLLIGSLVIAMYLPILQLGSVI